MTQEFDRTRVFQNIKVRTSLKNDASWIQNSEVGNEVQEKTRADQTVEYRPIRLSSYVLSTAKRFESHTPTEEQIQNAEAQPEKCVSDITTENNNDYTGTTVDQSNIEHMEVAPNGSADVSLETHTSNGEVVLPVEPTGQLAVKTKAVNNEVYANTADDHFNGEQDEVKVPEGDHVEGPIAEFSNAAGTEDSQGDAEVPTVLPAKLRPEEEFSFKIETINVTNLEDAEVESMVQPSEGGCEKFAPEQNTEEIVQALADGLVKTSLDMSDTIAATPGAEAALQDSVEPVPNMLEKSASESLSQQTVTEGTCENAPLDQAAVETAEAVTRLNVESSPENSVMPDAAGRDTAPQNSVEPTPENAADHVVEVNTEDVSEPVRASDAESVQSTFRGTELTHALDLEPPTTGAASASLKESGKPSSEEMKWNKLSYEIYRNGICSVCDKKIDGNVKIKFNDPPLNCHPDCLKCATCAKALGDLLTPIFSNNQTIICGVCFAKTL